MIALQPINLAIRTPVSEYLSRITAVCPFVEPSASAGLLSGCVITPECKSAEEIEPRCFEQLVPAIERFRIARSQLTEKQQRLLVCHIIIVHVPTQFDDVVRQQWIWPNWLAWSLKQIYTPKEIVFGFVRKNVIEKATFGPTIPAAPFHAVIIRSRVVNSDGKFFTGNQPMLEAMMQADDDNASAHSAIFPDHPDLADPAALRSANYFARVRAWGTAQLEQK